MTNTNTNTNTNINTAQSAASQTVHQLVQSQFGAVAAAYTSSIGHSDPNQLQQVVQLAQPKPSDRALDIATGAGHTALALAPHVAEVVAYDLTLPMLAETARNASQRGLNNVRTQQGMAEELPFPAASFDIATVRIASHHFAEIRRAVAEMARVVKAGGRVVVVDTTVPEDEALDRAINHLEVLRDPSHVRNYRPSEWQQMLSAVGLQITHTGVDYYTEQGPMDFAVWTQRMRTPPEVVAELARLFRNATPALVKALDIQLDDDKIKFYLPKVTLAAYKA